MLTVDRQKKSAPHAPGYRHVQSSPLHLILYLVAVVAFLLAWQYPQIPMSVICFLVGLCLLVVALCFQTLTVTGTDDRLVIRYGPLNVFGTQIKYADMTAVERGKSSIIDGWGIHFIPLRGWTFNLWGLDCAVVHLQRKVIRVGSDDANALVAFLQKQIARQND